MANKWDINFLKEITDNLVTTNNEEVDWKTHMLKDWQTVTLGDLNLTDELTKMFGKFTILNKSFAEQHSPWIMFAGNAGNPNQNQGFIVIIDKIFKNYKILTGYTIPGESREIETIESFNGLEDFDNDLHGQIFLVTKDDDKKLRLIVLSNPFVSEEIEDESLMLIKKIKLEDKKSLKWEDEGEPSDGDWHNFNDSLTISLTHDLSKDEVVEEIQMFSVHGEENNGITKSTLYVLRYSLWETSLLTKSTNDNIYYGVNLQADMKVYDDKYFITTNFANAGTITKSTELKSQANYITRVNGQNNKGYLWAGEPWDNTQADAIKWNDFDILTITNGRNNTFYTWASEYYRWLQSFNGMTYLWQKEKITFLFCSAWYVTRKPPFNGSIDVVPLDKDYQQPMNYSYVIQKTIPKETGGDRNLWYTLELVQNWLDYDNTTDSYTFNVNQKFGNYAGGSINSGDHLGSQFAFFLVKDINTTIGSKYVTNNPEINPEVAIPYIISSQLENILFEKGLEQTIYAQDDNGNIVTSTFIITKDGDVNITEMNTLKSASVPYSLKFFNVPAIKNKNELSIGYRDNNGFAKIKNILFHWEEDKIIEDKVFETGVAREIDKIYVYQVQNDIVFEMIKDDLVTGIGNVFTMNEEKTTNFHEAKYKDDYRLSNFFKDDNDIQYRVYSADEGKVVGASVPYNESEENSVYMRNPLNDFKYKGVFDLTRIGVLYNNFSLSDNMILQKNYDKVSVYSIIKPESLTYVESNKVSLINNKNNDILVSDKNILKNNLETVNLGFNLNLLSISNYSFIKPNENFLKYIGKDMSKFKISKLKYFDSTGKETTINLDNQQDKIFINDGNKLKIKFNIENADLYKFYFGETGKIMKNKN